MASIGTIDSSLLTGELEVYWDTDILIDLDEDGDPANDFNWDEGVWSEVGERQVLLRVCDGVEICTERVFVVTVYSGEVTTDPKSLGELTVDDLRPSEEKSRDPSTRGSSRHTMVDDTPSER